MLLLVLSVIIVILAVSGMSGVLARFWERIRGEAPRETASEAVRPVPMTTQGGMEKVEQSRRDFERMDSLVNSVRR